MVARDKNAFLCPNLYFLNLNSATVTDWSSGRDEWQWFIQARSLFSL